MYVRYEHWWGNRIRGRQTDTVGVGLPRRVAVTRLRGRAESLTSKWLFHVRRTDGGVLSSRFGLGTLLPSAFGPFSPARIDVDD